MSERAGFLCSRESFMIDALTFKGTCQICMRKGEMKLGWLECKCEQCGEYFSRDTLNETVKKRRLYIGWSIKQMAFVTSLKESTIKRYENVWHWPSKKYYKLTAGLVKAYNQQQIDKKASIPEDLMIRDFPK